MANFELHQDKAIGYGESGFNAASVEYYIKLKAGFRDFLSQLKGAPLSCFMAIALHETEIALNDAPPLTISEMAEQTDFSRRACVYAADDLLRLNFIVVVGKRADGAKFYRPSVYAWFGSDSPVSSDGGGDKPQDSTKGMQKLHTRTPVQNVAEGMQNEAPPYAKNSKEAMQKTTKAVHSPVHVMNDDVLNINHKEKTSSSIHGKDSETRAIEAILAHAFDGINVQRLAARIDEPELAQGWVDWCNDSETHQRYSNPQGIAYRALMETRNARPHSFHKREPEPRATRGSYNLAASQHQCGTMAHRLWARSNGGCEACGIPPNKRETDDESA